MVAGVVLLAVGLVPALFAHPHMVYDSGQYLAAPSLSSGRLPVVPLVYRALADNWTAIKVVQVLIGAVGWGALLWELDHVPGRWARGLATLGVLAIACSAYVVDWYAALLSDSLSISLLALSVAALVHWNRTRRWLWPAVAVISVWAMTRSTNGYVVVFAGAVAAAWAAGHRGRHLGPALLLLVAGGTTVFLAGRGDLWEQPFLHSISERILPSRSFTAWFVAHGMPMSPVLRAQSGPYTLSVDAAYRNSPALISFRDWMAGSGRTTFAEFVATHPTWAVTGTFAHHQDFTLPTIRYYGGWVGRPWWPAPVPDYLVQHSQNTLIGLAVVDGAAAAVFWRRVRWTATLGLAVALATAGLLTLVLDWSADSWEIPRHSIDGTLLVALAEILVLTTFGGRRAPA